MKPLPRIGITTLRIEPHDNEVFGLAGSSASSSSFARFGRKSLNIHRTRYISAKQFDSLIIHEVWDVRVRGWYTELA